MSNTRSPYGGMPNQQPGGSEPRYQQTPGAYTQQSAQPTGYRPYQPQQQAPAYSQQGPAGYTQQPNQGRQSAPYVQQAGYQRPNVYGQQVQNPAYSQQPVSYQQSPYGGMQNGGVPQQQGGMYGYNAGNPYQQGGQNTAYHAQGGSGYGVPNQPYANGYGSQPVNHNGAAYPQGNGGQVPYQQPYRPAAGYGQSPYNGYAPYQQGMGGVGKTKKAFPAELIEKIVLFGVLPLLFVAALLFGKIPALAFVFAAAACMMIVAMWVKPVLSRNLKLCATCVYSVLAIVALVTALYNPPADGQQPQGNPSGMPAVTPDPIGQQAIWEEQNTAYPQAMPVPTPAPEDDGLSGETASRLKNFLDFWAVNNMDNMLELCAPSWARTVESPKVSLFSILANRIPTDYEFEKISGTENDLSRTVTITAYIDKQNGKAAEKYRFSIIMSKEDGIWYVDPASLESNVRETATPTPAPATQTPIPVATSDPNLTLYYNTSGGSYYHLDANCRRIADKYKPLKGKLKYSQLNEDQFKNLSACGACGAPLRGE